MPAYGVRAVSNALKMFYLTKEFSEIYLSEVLDKTVINSKGEDLGVLHNLIMVPSEV